MVSLSRRKSVLRLAAACLTAFGFLLVGPSYGQGRIEKGSKLAEKIEGYGRIMIVTPEGAVIGRRPAILEEGIALSRADRLGSDNQAGPTTIAWERILTIKSPKSGAATGGWAGGGSGALIGLALTAVVSRNEDMSASAGLLIRGMFVGGVAGALTGSLIGSLFKHWKTLYSTPGAGLLVPTLSIAPGPRGGASFSVALAF